MIWGEGRRIPSAVVALLAALIASLGFVLSASRSHAAHAAVLTDTSPEPPPPATTTAPTPDPAPTPVPAPKPAPRKPVSRPSPPPTPAPRPTSAATTPTPRYTPPLHHRHHRQAHAKKLRHRQAPAGPPVRFKPPIPGPLGAEPAAAVVPQPEDSARPLLLGGVACALVLFAIATWLPVGRLQATAVGQAIVDHRADFVFLGIAVLLVSAAVYFVA